ncbi:hypothetical protein MPH_07800 [Macrophomina phaseolina MS6]|uniref:DUF7728 domain-containing protein n=1 Tax=Macrophomina phaseolina (strain MS6) TaxID=1126212 RepID=K2QYK8_MACPH|nr:hypothetical protein MPH_07800 [Macrophomina phaseolina MS6]
MKSHAFGLGAALALAAPSAAFLLPSTADGVVPDREFSLVDTTSQLLTLDCPGCPFAGSSDDDLVWVQGVENSLLLNFSVVEGHSIELNGVKLYPPSFDTIPQPIPVYQVRADIPLTDIRANIGKYTDKPLRISAYALEIDPAVTGSAGDELVPMTLQLSSLEAHRIGVPALSVKLIKHPEGGLSILPITTAAPIHGSEPQQNDDECESWPVLCKWRAMIADRIHSMKGGLNKIKGGCMKGRPHATGKPEEHQERPNHLPGHRRPHHGPHGIMRHHRSGPLARFFATIGRVMIPIAIGISIGALTYAMGWLLGCIIAYAWVKYNQRRGNGYEVVAADEEDVLAKADIPAEAPPVYTEKEAASEEEGIEDRQL